jgi:hypothetical protein
VPELLKKQGEIQKRKGTLELGGSRGRDVTVQSEKHSDRGWSPGEIRVRKQDAIFWSYKMPEFLLGGHGADQ